MISLLMLLFALMAWLPCEAETIDGQKAKRDSCSISKHVERAVVNCQYSWKFIPYPEWVADHGSCAPEVLLNEGAPSSLEFDCSLGYNEAVGELHIYCDEFLTAIYSIVIRDGLVTTVLLEDF